MEFFDAVEKKGANSDTMCWCVWVLGEPIVPADPLLNKSGTEAAGESDDEAEEPKDIDVNGITWSFEWVEGLRGDADEFLGNLLKKPSGHVGGIGLEALVTLDEECGNGCGEYTRLETVLWM
jgi:hypothetical protein